MTAKELGMQRASDQDLLRKAREIDRLLITRNKDLGSLLFLEEKLLTGVILLRMVPVTVEEVHRELRRLFHEHSEEELKHLSAWLNPIAIEFVVYPVSWWAYLVARINKSKRDSQVALELTFAHEYPQGTMTYQLFRITSND